MDSIRAVEAYGRQVLQQASVGSVQARTLAHWTVMHLHKRALSSPEEIRRFVFSGLNRFGCSVTEKRPDHFLACISFGFDRDDEMAGPFLDPLNPQSRYAEQLFGLVEDVILSDSRYVARLERHYEMVKQAASDPRHPAYRRLQKVLEDDAAAFPLPRHASRTKRAGRDAPCPCGSGKKYKHCCMQKGRR